MTVVSCEPERTEDAAAIRDVILRAFADHPAVADLVERIRASDRYLPELALVARAGRTVTGFVMISSAEVEADDGTRRAVLTLSPLGVAPEHQRQGVGRALVRAVLDAAVTRDPTGSGLVTLEGSPRFYGRLGFVFAPSHGIAFRLPDWAPREAAQVYLLPGHDPTVRGRVVYPPAFDGI